MGLNMVSEKEEWIRRIGDRSAIGKSYEYVGRKAVGPGDIFWLGLSVFRLTVLLPSTHRLALP
jgi:hypothetical protein